MKLETTFQVEAGRPRYRTPATLAIVFSPVLFYAVIRLYDAAAVAGQVAALGALALVVSSAVALAKRSEVKGEVTADATGVRLGTFWIARERIASASFVPENAARGAHVQIRGPNEELGWIGVKGRPQANELLRALGMSSSETTASFAAFTPMATPTGNAFVIAAVAAGALWVALAALGSFHLGWGLLALFVLARTYWFRARFVVGADGFFHAMRVRPRFVPWKDVARIEAHPRGLTITLHSGEKVVVLLTRATGTSDDAEVHAVRDAALAHAREAFEAFRGGEVPDISARIARQGRTTTEWVAALSDREGTFRQAPLRSEDLWRVVESVAADTSARAAAAAVLAADATSEERARLRVAADACVEPRLRVVLERASSGGDVMEALDEVEDERAARQDV